MPKAYWLLQVKHLAAGKRLSADKWSGRSLTELKNTTRPMTEPWGTPLMASAVRDRVSMTFTKKVRRLRKHSTLLITMGAMLHFVSLARKSRCLTELKVVVKVDCISFVETFCYQFFCYRDASKENWYKFSGIFSLKVTSSTLQTTDCLFCFAG